MKRLVETLIQQLDNDNKIWTETERELIQEVISSTNEKSLTDALNSDPYDDLPVATKIIMLRRAVELNRNRQNLEALASYLLRHGPVWDEEANKLMKEAAKLDLPE